MEVWTKEADGYRLQIKLEPREDKLDERSLSRAQMKRCESIWMHLQKRYSVRDDKIQTFAFDVIERMARNGGIDIKSIPDIVYKRFTIENYDPLKDSELEPIPEIYKQLDDLQPKHLTKQGSCYFIQNAWFQRLLSSLDIEHDVLSQQLLFDSSSWYQGTSRNIKTNPFSLNIHHNKIASGTGRYKHYREEWIIDINRYDEFKRFMSSLKTKHTDPSTLTSAHQGCYLIQLNCDEGTNKYKLGKSENLLKRLKSAEYKNAFIYMVCYVSDIDECENELIREFTSHFTQVLSDDRGNYGREMFSGAINEMMDLFYEICSKFR